MRTIQIPELLYTLNESFMIVDSVKVDSYGKDEDELHGLLFL